MLSWGIASSCQSKLTLITFDLLQGLPVREARVELLGDRDLVEEKLREAAPIDSLCTLPTCAIPDHSVLVTAASDAVQGRLLARGHMHNCRCRGLASPTL